MARRKKSQHGSPYLYTGEIGPNPEDWQNYDQAHSGLEEAEDRAEIERKRREYLDEIVHGMEGQVKTIYKISIPSPSGKAAHVYWWTNDNLDLGTVNQEASLDYDFNTEGDAWDFVRGNTLSGGIPIKNSWYGWLYGTPVEVWVNGVMLPFEHTE